MKEKSAISLMYVHTIGIHIIAHVSVVNSDRIKIYVRHYT
jgi:hypothetical protein